MSLAPQKALAAELWAMIAIQTLGAVDIPKPGKADSGGRKLPAPRNYAAAFVLFAILGFVAQLGPRQGRVATAIGGAAILSAMLVGVAGPGTKHPGQSLGGRVLAFLNRVARLFAPTRGGGGGAGGVEPEEPPNQEV